MNIKVIKIQRINQNQIKIQNRNEKRIFVKKNYYKYFTVPWFLFSIFTFQFLIPCSPPKKVDPCWYLLCRREKTTASKKITRFSPLSLPFSLTLSLTHARTHAHTHFLSLSRLYCSRPWLGDHQGQVRRKSVIKKINSLFDGPHTHSRRCFLSLSLSLSHTHSLSRSLVKIESKSFSFSCERKEKRTFKNAQSFVLFSGNTIASLVTSC